MFPTDPQSPASRIASFDPDAIRRFPRDPNAPTADPLPREVTGPTAGYSDPTAWSAAVANDPALRAIVAHRSWHLRTAS